MILILFFIIGATIGSFLNVLIDRLPKGEQVVKGRSHCDHCHKKLGFFDLVPLLSFLLLGGRCRYCRKKISFFYPLVEFLTGIIFVMSFNFYNPTTLASIFPASPAGGQLLTSLVVICSLIVIFFTDLKYYIIPDEMIVVGIIATILHIFVFSYSPTNIVSLLNCYIVALVSGIIAGIFFFLLFLITKGKGMGQGDIKLAFLMGLLLGWPKIILAVYIAFLTGALVGVILILVGKKRFGQIIPFGPFLVLGTLAAIFYSNQLLNLWLRFL